MRSWNHYIHRYVNLGRNEIIKKNMEKCAISFFLVVLALTASSAKLIPFTRMLNATYYF